MNNLPDLILKRNAMGIIEGFWLHGEYYDADSPVGERILGGNRLAIVIDPENKSGMNGLKVMADD